jgi:hypothetical protein
VGAAVEFDDVESAIGAEEEDEMWSEGMIGVFS